MRLAKYAVVWVIGVALWTSLMVLFSVPWWASFLATLVFGCVFTTVLLNEYYYDEE